MKKVQSKERADHPSSIYSVMANNKMEIQDPGQPLTESTRNFFEPRFGRDFRRVRIHTDDKADSSARMLNAQAFTIGRHIYFRSEHYAPGNTEGIRLLAHELTHTIQQEGVIAEQKDRKNNNRIEVTGTNASGQAFAQMRVMIGTGDNSHEISTREMVDIIYRPFDGTEATGIDRTQTETSPAMRSRYTIDRNRQRALTIVNDMRYASENLNFQDLDAMRVEVARRIEAEQGSLPRELTISDARTWLDNNNISYTETSRHAVHFSNSITVDFSQAAPGFNLIDGRDRVSNSHPVTPQLAVALVRLIRHLNDQGVTALHHSGISVGTHLLLGYAIDIRGFTFNDGTEILLPPAWNDNTTTLPSGETAQIYMQRIAMWMAGNIFGQVLGPGYPNHDNHFHCQVPYGRIYRGLVTSAP